MTTESTVSDSIVLRVNKIKKRFNNIALLCTFVSFEA